MQRRLRASAAPQVELRRRVLREERLQPRAQRFAQFRMRGIVIQVAPLLRIGREIVELVRAVGMPQNQFGLLRAHGPDRFEFEKHHVVPSGGRFSAQRR